MNEFLAEKVLGIGISLALSAHTLSEHKAGTPEWEGRLNQQITAMEYMAKLLDQIGCVVAANLTRHVAQQLPRLARQHPQTILESQSSLVETISNEMKAQLFFWVPSQRAVFYSKTGRDILGDECVDRFAKADIANEAEQASKCFAFGQYTACVFHLMRITEAGVLALGNAIAFQWGDNPNWGRMFKAFDAQSAVDAGKRVGVWKEHGDFLDTVGGHFRAVKNAWRNNTMHLDKNYDESQAKHLMSVIPAFMKQLASRVDESGNFL